MIDIVLPIWKEWKEDSFKKCFRDRSNYIVYADGAAIGHIGLKVEDNILRIQDIQLDSEHQSQGYGRQCMKWIERYAEDKNCAQLELVVFKSNSIAYGYYDKLGFRVEKELEHSLVLIK
ncbi:MAG: GNAT family N-acetyltransferase, partial [Spirochaetales bacterium]|nr:GNAT family N-acetyltransferase [Spirochaetales bacterium]